LIWSIIGKREEVEPFYERSEPRLKIGLAAAMRHSLAVGGRFVLGR
jgi:hypothetical protein